MRYHRVSAGSRHKKLSASVHLCRCIAKVKHTFCHEPDKSCPLNGDACDGVCVRKAFTPPPCSKSVREARTKVCAGEEDPGARGSAAGRQVGVGAFSASLWRSGYWYETSVSIAISNMTIEGLNHHRGVVSAPGCLVWVKAKRYSMSCCGAGR